MYKRVCVRVRSFVPLCLRFNVPVLFRVMVTADGQSASLSWCETPIWGSSPDFCYCQTVAGLLMWGALSTERTGLSFTVAAGPRQQGHSRERWVC
jgi:hypothetical protein